MSFVFTVYIFLLVGMLPRVNLATLKVMEVAVAAQAAKRKKKRPAVDAG